MALSLKGTQTEKNLLIAFAGESQARNRYSFFASKAKDEGYQAIGKIFTETAEQEREHASRLFKFLEGGAIEITAAFPAGKIGTTLENLQAAAYGEHVATWMRVMCESASMGLRTTTIRIVVQLGLAMMPRGRTRASSALHSGTTRGTSASIRKALELSIMTAPYFVIVSANSREVPAPAEVKATATSLKSSLCCNNFTSIS